MIPDGVMASLPEPGEIDELLGRIWEELLDVASVSKRMYESGYDEESLGENYEWLGEIELEAHDRRDEVLKRYAEYRRDGEDVER
jgi:hypothetical protein